MAREIHRLTALAISKKKHPGAYADGGGLWLQVTETGSKSWSFRFMLGGRAREMGLGPLHTVSLADAREQARACRALHRDGVDPIEHRKLGRAEAALQMRCAKTFDQCAAGYIEAQRPGWSNPKHADQWTNTLKTYASPVFGQLPVQAVDTELIVEALNKIWTSKTETATRVRQRIESVLDWATVSGFRKGDNPARWAGHLEHKLTNPAKLKNVENLPALPFAKIASFLADLRKEEGIAARAMEFMILTAARTGDVRGALWSEIDFEEKAWTIPAERMKMKREHRVPLCDRALAILEDMQKLKADDQPYVFPGGKVGKAMSDGALLALLKRMKRTEITPHGFRSTFRDWGSECTAYSHEVQELALAHLIKNKAEAAYRRGDLFDKRRQLMDEWQRYCETTVPARVVSNKKE
ncbi:MAG: integrase arm-type DNA-binding domain-containing protein [Burkholderiales bacterium]|nr:integrase arm-type DNA-binding domain-containing protein [Burkholderiales bacterium]